MYSNAEILCEDLKTSCIKNDSGRIVENDRSKSADIFHKLGKLYAANVHEDAYNYIYSLGLLVASKITVEIPLIQDSIQCLWISLLQQANAVKFNSNLVSVMAPIEDLIKTMRHHSSMKVSKISKVNSFSEPEEREKIVFVRSVAEEISGQFIDVMENVSNICVKILYGEDNPVPMFSLCALGSVAKGEATPYSDFEHMILLEDDLDEMVLQRLKEQMRWYAIIFQFLIVNLGETPVRLLGVPCLNDFYTDDKSKDWFYDIITPCGIRFDSNMPFASIHPLSRKETIKKSFKTELIQPVSIMVQYLKTDAICRNGYHLDTVLSKSVLVAGSLSLHDKYKKKITNKLQGQTSTILSSIKTCMDKENILFEMKNRNNGGNIKKICYRGCSVIIGHLGSMFNVADSNSFTIIDQLVKFGHLNHDAGHNLKYIVALSWELRSKLYENAQQQIAEVNRTQNAVTQLADVIGRNSLFAFCTIWFSFWNVLQPIVLSDTARGLRDKIKISHDSMRSKDSRIAKLCTAFLCPKELDISRKSDPLLYIKNNLWSGLFAQVALVHVEQAFNLFLEVFREFDSTSCPHISDTERVTTKLKQMFDSFVAFPRKPKTTGGFISLTDLSTCFFGRVYDSPCFERFYDAAYTAACIISPYVDLKQISRFGACFYRVGDLCDELRTLQESWKNFDESKMLQISDTCGTICKCIDEVKANMNRVRPKYSKLQSVLVSLAKNVVKADKPLYGLSDTKNMFKRLLQEKPEFYHSRMLNRTQSSNAIFNQFSWLTPSLPNRVMVSVFIDRVILGLSFAKAELIYHVALAWYRKGCYQDSMRCCFDSLTCVTNECAKLERKYFSYTTKTLRLLGLCSFKRRNFRHALNSFQCKLELSAYREHYVPDKSLRTLRTFVNKHR